MKKALTVMAAASDGSHRDLLVALRSRIAATVEDSTTPPRDLASLSRRLMEIAKEIEAIDAADGEGSIGDAIATPDEPFDAAAL